MPSQGRYAARAEQGGRSFSGTLVRTNPHTVRFERCPGPGIAAAYRPSSEGSLRRPHRACGLCTRRGNAEGQAPARWLWVRPSPKNTWPPGDFTPPPPPHTHTHTYTPSLLAAAAPLLLPVPCICLFLAARGAYVSWSNGCESCSQRLKDSFVHVYWGSIGLPNAKHTSLDELRPCSHVRPTALTKLPVLFCAGMSGSENAALLDRLESHCLQPQFRCSSPHAMMSFGAPSQITSSLLLLECAATAAISRAIQQHCTYNPCTAPCEKLKLHRGHQTAWHKQEPWCGSVTNATQCHSSMPLI